MRKYTFFWVFVLGCKTSVELIAPDAQDRTVVYAILNSDSALQYIRVGRLFVTRENAAAYAAQNDLSIQAQVSLTDGQTTWQATPIQVEKFPNKPFYPKQTLYRVAMRPIPGKTYTLRVQVENQPTLSVEAQTRVPLMPYITRPESLIPLSGNQLGYPSWNLSKKNFIEFYESWPVPPRSQVGAYELRVLLRTQTDTFRILGPIRFKDLNPRCQGVYQCYTLAEKELLYSGKARLGEKAYTYDNSHLSQAWELQITAMDTALYNYLRINDPATTDFTTVKPEYTNIMGGLGIFGAISTGRRFFRIDACSEHLLRLNNTPPPSQDCVLN
ncbi:MAG: DUF4249 family protein [Bacteroidia bacterium]